MRRPLDDRSCPGSREIGEFAVAKMLRETH